MPVAHREVDRAAVAAAPPPDVATNALPTPNSRIWAIVVDDLSIIEQDLVPTKRVLTDIVQSIPTDDKVAIVYVGRSDLGQNFTSNTGLLMNAVNHLRAALGFGFDALPGGNALPKTDDTTVPSGGTGGTAPASSAASTPGSAAPADLVFEQARTAFDTLRYVAGALAGSGHERRAIVYVGGMTTAFQTDDRYQREIRKTFAEAKRADVPIYTVDPRGGVTAEDAVRHGIGEIPDLATRALIVTNLENQWDWLSEIAVNTGGRAFFHEADLAKAVHDLVEDNSSFYLLSYSPVPFPHDGQVHDITVKVNRPGVHVRARQGYVAPGASADATSLAASVNDAMTKGVDASGLTLRGWAAPLAVSSDGMKTALTVEVSFAAPAGSSHRIDDEMQMNVLALDPDGRVRASSAHAVKFEGTVPATGDATFLMDDVVDLPSRPLTLRIAVASQSLGRAGSIQLAVDVPKPSDGDLQMSGIAVGTVGEHAEAALRAGVLGDVVPFQPTTTRTFSADETLRVYGRLFWGTRAPKVTIAIQGTAAAARTLLLSRAPAGNGRSAGAIDTTVPLTGLTSGDHVIEITAHLANGKPVTREIPITVR